MNIRKIIDENCRRNALLSVAYNPVNGEGCCGPRTQADFGGCRAWLPDAMLDDPAYRSARGNFNALRRLRCHHDFEYWAVSCVKIRDKLSGSDIAFVLNAPQRRVVSVLEEQRRAGRPMRLIILKARQWGGSTLVQVYMAWIQTVLRRNWHSLICAHVKDTASTIRAMYTKLLENYPEDLWEGDEPPRFKAFERSSNTREIAGRGCRVTLGSSENQEASRGTDIAMAHLSEVAFWKDSRLHCPDELVRAAVSGIALAPMTFIAMESTANGVGSYFHNEWLRAEAGLSDKAPVFVPWHEIEIYRMAVDNPEALWNGMDEYERRLWDNGLTLEMIAWYHAKRREMSTDARMMAEYPTTAVEAFANTGSGVFGVAAVERLRGGCSMPSRRGDVTACAVIGVEALENTGWRDDPDGPMRLWRLPEPGRDYVVSVDVGGRSDSADWSVIAVFAVDCDRPEVVAQWRGHGDHDLLAWKSAMIASFFNNALLVIESNTLETEAVPGEPSVLLDQLGTAYANLYMRRTSEDGHGVFRPGFHTNVKTKAAAIARLVAAVRDGGYIERDNEACNELLTYEQLPSGAYAARRGCHDDILMTRAIALSVISHREERPRLSSADLLPVDSWADRW